MRWPAATYWAVDSQHPVLFAALAGTVVATIVVRRTGSRQAARHFALVRVRNVARPSPVNG